MRSGIRLGDQRLYSDTFTDREKILRYLERISFRHGSLIVDCRYDSSRLIADERDTRKINYFSLYMLSL